MEMTRRNPPDLFDSRPFGVSQTVVAPTASRLVHLSGQVAWDANRQITGKDDLEAQVVQSLWNIETALLHIGATLQHVIALRLYIKHSHMSEGKAIRAGLRSSLATTFPARPGSAYRASPAPTGAPVPTELLSQPLGAQIRLLVRTGDDEPRAITLIAGGPELRPLASLGLAPAAPADPKGGNGSTLHFS